MFVKEELSLGRIVGPMPDAQFREWCHISPQMSREKKGEEDRRIIIDMTFPEQTSVNAYIFKKYYYGSTA